MAEVTLDGARYAALLEAVRVNVRDLFQRNGLILTPDMQSLIIEAVRKAVMAQAADLVDGVLRENAAQQEVTEEQRRAYREFRTPGINLRKSEIGPGQGTLFPEAGAKRGKGADFIIADDPVRGPVTEEELRAYMDGKPDDMDRVRRRLAEKMIEHMSRKIAGDGPRPTPNEIHTHVADNPGEMVGLIPPADGNPYSDLPIGDNPCRDIPPSKLNPLRDDQRRALDALNTSLRKPANPPEVEQAALGVPAADHGPDVSPGVHPVYERAYQRTVTPANPGAHVGHDLDIHEREAIVESVRQQYGEHAARAEEARLKALCREARQVRGKPFEGAVEGTLTSTTPGCAPREMAAAEVERAIYDTLRDIGHQAPEGRLLPLAARLAEEVAEAGASSVDGRPVLGRLQALHNLNWLLRNKFPPDKITAGKIARIGQAK